jgi:protein involved in polysaccharide export with SLBB domain
MKTNVLIAWIVLFAIAVSPMTTAAQNSADVARRPKSSNANFGADQEADRLVSLSPDKIIEILSEEPGLLLAVKRALVRKAYEQGRILDPQELTDNSVFQLIRDDENIRVIASKEVEDRFYVRAKPNREEREQAGAAAMLAAQEGQRDTQMASSSENTQQLAVRQNQEDAYWAKHDRDPAAGSFTSPAPYEDLAPEAPPSQPPSRNPSTSDPRRQLQMADVQDAPQTYNADLPPQFADSMPRVHPADLPELLNASDTASISSLNRGSNRAAITPAIPLEPPSFGSPDLLQDRGNQLAPQPRPTNRQGTSAFSQGDDHPAMRHRANPYADIPALYDLYSQYSKHSPILERFGADVFRNGTGNLDELPMDLPAGPDYVLGPGDGLSIDVFGGVSQRLQRVVDREGRVALPQVGSVQVTGRTLGDVQDMVQATLRTEFRDVQADVSLARLRTVRIYIVGDVEKPGAYDVSSLSTPLNALYLAQGPTTRGSLRTLQHYRGKRLVEQIDVYDLLLHGIRSDLERFQPGDTLLIPPLGPQITVEGMVRRPAIYELSAEKSLSEVLELAGGVLPTGTLREIQVERLQAHDHHTMLRLDLPEANNQQAMNDALYQFKIQDGDTIRISPVLPYSDKTVYLDGHVFHPGKYAYREGMKVSDIIKSYNDLLPEPYKRHAEVIRLNPPDFSPTVMAFNLEEALAGKEQDVPLKPFDTIRVFGRYEFEDPPVVTVSGEVRDPGDHVTNGATNLRDAIFLAGGATPDAQLESAQIFRRLEDGKLKVISVNLSKALAGDPAENIALLSKDRVLIHRNLSKSDPPTVTIQGEVAHPGKYPLGGDMSAAQLVQVAGGLKRGAYTEEADLTRYMIAQGSSIAGEHIAVPIGQALQNAPDTDVRLRDGDVLTIRQLTGWNDVGSTIAVKGEVIHPGTYGIQEGERLSTILERAGGLRADAYPYGAILEREQVRELEEQHRAQLIHEVQEQGIGLKLTPDVDEDQKAAKEASLMQWQTALDRLKTSPPVGRLVIHISRDVKRWKNTSADIQIRAGDSLFIPKKPNFVMVDGSVYNPTAVTYKPGKNAEWYLRQAGGPNNVANKKSVFVIRADGSVTGGSGGVFSGGALETGLEPGDMVIVPEKAFSGTSKWRTTLQAAQLVSSVGIAVQVARGF